MATLIIPDNTPPAELDKLARAMGKRLQYRPQPATKPQPEDTPSAVHPRATHPQPGHGLADCTHQH